MYGQRLWWAYMARKWGLSDKEREELRIEREREAAADAAETARVAALAQEAGIDPADWIDF